MLSESGGLSPAMVVLQQVWSIKGVVEILGSRSAVIDYWDPELLTGFRYEMFTELSAVKPIPLSVTDAAGWVLKWGKL